MVVVDTRYVRVGDTKNEDKYETVTSTGTGTNNKTSPEITITIDYKAAYRVTALAVLAAKRKQAKLREDTARGEGFGAGVIVTLVLVGGWWGCVWLVGLLFG